MDVVAPVFPVEVGDVGVVAPMESIGVTGGYSTEKKAPKVRQSEVIYQIYPASFKDSGQTKREGEYEEYKGWGDLKGIKDKLSYVKDLGVDAVWISPFFLSPKGKPGDGGYAISAYDKVDPRFGTMKDFEDLLAEAHKPYEGHPDGLRVYTDFVLCHTSNEHGWFKKSRNKESGFENFYVWSDGEKDDAGNLIKNKRGELINDDNEPIEKNAQGKYIKKQRGEHGEEIPSRPRIPNNWLSVFNGQRAWTWDDTRQQYYMHHFNTSQPSLNLNDKTVQKASRDQMKIWLDMGVDGLRIDALPYANYDPEFNHDKWIKDYYDRNDDRWGAQWVTNSMCREQTENEVLPAIRELANSPEYKTKKRIIVEAIAGRKGGGEDVEQAARYIDQEKGADCAYTNAFVSLFYPRDGDPGGYPTAQRVRGTIKELIERSPDGGYCHNLSNHDFPRYAGRMGDGVPDALKPDAEKQLLKLVSTLQGSVCLYNGDELGLPQATAQDLNPDYLKKFINEDGQPKYPNGKRQDLLDGEANRDGCRTPMPWEAWGTNMGFSDHGDPYLPLPASHKVRAVDVQKTQPNSSLKITQRILEQRKDNPALNQGKTTFLHTIDEHPFVAFVRETDDSVDDQGNRVEGQAVLCAFNMSGERGRYFVPSKVPELRDNPELLKKIQRSSGITLSEDGKTGEVKVYIPPYGSTFIGLSQAREADAEIGMQTLRVNDASVGLEIPKTLKSQQPKIFAADLLITDIHMSGEAAEDALNKIIGGKSNQERIKDNKPAVEWGEKSTIDEKEYEILLAASQTGDPLTAGGSTSCVLGTLKQLLKKIAINIMGFPTDDEHGRVIKDFLKRADIEVTGDWLRNTEPQQAVSFIIEHTEGKHKGKHTILTYPGHQIDAFHKYQAQALKQVENNIDPKLRTAMTLREKIQDCTIVYLPDSTLDKYELPITQKILEWRWEGQKQLVLALPTHADFGPTYSDFFKYLIPSCNVVMGNDVEFYRILTGKEKARKDIKDEDITMITDRLQEMFDRKVLENAKMPCPKNQVAFITRGEEPALLVTKTQKYIDGEKVPSVIEVPVIPIKETEIKNKLGAGNAAFAGFLAGYINGLDHKQSAEEAMRQAAEKIRQDNPAPYILNPQSRTISSASAQRRGVSPGE